MNLRLRAAEPSDPVCTEDGPMYKLHLILKYLLKRRIAWVSLVAVMLCTTMVVVVRSVMGGWLTCSASRSTGSRGDIVIEGDTLSGFPYYEEIIERVEGLPEVEAAVPTIYTFGLINIANLQERRRAGDRLPDRENQPGSTTSTTSLHRQHQALLDEAERPETPPVRAELLRADGAAAADVRPADVRPRAAGTPAGRRRPRTQRTRSGSATTPSIAG